MRAVSNQPQEVEYRVVVHRDDDDSMWAEVEELPGLFVTAESEAELAEALAEAVALYLSTPTSGLHVRVDAFGPRRTTMDATVHLTPA